MLPLSRVCQCMSSIKRKPTENRLAGLECALLANPQQNFGRSSAHFTGIVRSRVHGKESRNCARRVVESGGGAELSGLGKRNGEDASEASRATIFFSFSCVHKCHGRNTRSDAINKQSRAAHRAISEKEVRAGQKPLSLCLCNSVKVPMQGGVDSVTMLPRNTAFYQKGCKTRCPSRCGMVSAGQNLT